ncbi:MAG: hypothetical protein QOG50_1350 [Actinomycetota bacterium]|nr:hypothetical protein [Actinomycetota bacterium]
MQTLAFAPFPPARTIINRPVPLPPRLLAALAIKHASVATFDEIAEPLAGERSSARVFCSETHDIWLIRWGAGARTELHDHGESAGALYVVGGELVEHRPNPAGRGRSLRRVLRQLDDRPMAPSHIHEIANESDTVATSVHVYSPPLAAMHHFDFTPDSELRMIRREVIDTSGSAFA